MLYRVSFRLLVSLCALIVLLAPSFLFALDVSSPDDNIRVHFQVAGELQSLFWSVDYKGKSVLEKSQLGFDLNEKADIIEGFSVVSSKTASHDKTWKPVYGERSEVLDRYNSLLVSLCDKAGRLMSIEFRAYNEGAALSYTIPEQSQLGNYTIKSELTQFVFGADHRTYPVYSAQGRYADTTLSKVKANCERPLLVEIENGPAVAVAEANLVNYSRMRLQPVKDKPYSLMPHLGSEVKVSGGALTTPWRVLMVADWAGKLIEQNYLLENLSAPCAIADTSWIKPGKVIREVSLTTQGGMDCVDFAVKQNLQYIEYDAGWYGNEYDDKSDATTISVDPKRSKGPLDLQAVIRYGESKGIGVIVYVNRRALEKQLDAILPLFRKWGIKGVKYGFVRVGSQEWTAWLHDAVQKAAENHLMVDIHDEYRPTGFSRTYPNLMTQEGIGGNETMPDSRQNLLMAFSRTLCGAGDYTICIYDRRVKSSRVHQLAASVVFYSPWQFVYWYDRPAMFQDEPELAVIKNIKTVWDETRVLQGKSGEFITMARRSGNEWYLVSMNAIERRKLDISLDFLPEGKSFAATIYADGNPAGDEKTNVAITKRTVKRGDMISVDMAANGGQVVHLVPGK